MPKKEIKMAYQEKVINNYVNYSANASGAVAIDKYISAGTKEYKNTGIALFFVGFASFSMIYCVQPLLPAFAKSFGVSPANSSLALSLTTFFLAISIFLMGAISQIFDRKKMIYISMLSGAILNFIAAFVPHWHQLLLARALEGFVLGGVPAVAMAYISEEINPKNLGRSMGLYIAGNGFGAMVGRVGMGALTEFTSWHLAMALMGIICILSAFAFYILLPAPRNSVRTNKMDIKVHLNAWKGHLANKNLLRVYLLGFLLTGVFVTIFNYTTFRLSAAPFNLSQFMIAMLFLAFGFGVISSSLAGGLSDKIGRKPVIIGGFALMLAGVLVSFLSSLVTIIIAIILVTTGFFVAHAAASSSIGFIAKENKGHASSLYLLFYYFGSSIVGSLGGILWHNGGWASVATLCAAMSLIAIITANSLVAIKKDR